MMASLTTLCALNLDATRFAPRGTSSRWKLILSYMSRIYIARKSYHHDIGYYEDYRYHDGAPARAGRVLLTRAYEASYLGNECIAQNSWSALRRTVDCWLNARASRHAHIMITGCSPDRDALYTTQFDSFGLILRYQMEHEIDMRTHNGSKTLTYMRFKRDYIFEDCLSSMACCQLRKHETKHHWLGVPRVACPQIRMSSHALPRPAWKAGLVVNTRQSTISSSNCYACYRIRRSQKFRPLLVFADLETETLYALYHKMITLECQVSSPMQRRENQGH